ncbi:MFS transporter [Microbacterium immunditiarum]|uniref:DHA3 family multidrug efflux protein-like MFS transporter n=1 Tax=Microbacterium immunditiarum TaxID=337480 RepID=A0A7Y9GTM6_9MICO|nr:DHA3 family multidrug efflux protein-like MFS transporter [Microbacterium immunditiarum]
MSSDAPGPSTAAQRTVVPPPNGMRIFFQVLVNTAAANVTTSFLWFALTFWVYLETRSVLATGIVGGSYMLLVAVFSMVFGTLVDRHRKQRVMVLSSLVTLASFLVAGALYLAQPESVLVDITGPWFWLFTGIILFGAVIENLRNIALSTTVTLLVPVERHANANGMVGTVQGIAFVVTSVFSGLSVGFLGMGGTLAIALVATAIAFLHLLTFRIPEEQPDPDENRAKAFDFRGSIRAVRAVKGLFALILFSTFNNFIGGAYIALMDPYGLTLFTVQWWGVVLGITATGFIVGGLVVAKWGLGRNPIRTLLLVVIAMGVLGALFTIREWSWLYIVGIYAYMAIIPAAEAAEQTVIQKVVPFRRQGRVFGFAAAIESATAPITAFLIAPIAEFLIIPYMDTDSGRATWGWLLGEGEARGIALIFLFAGLILVAVALLAFLTPSYRILSAEYQEGLTDADAEAGGDAEGETDGPAQGGDVEEARPGAGATDPSPNGAGAAPIDVGPPSTKDVIGGVVDGKRRA